MARFPGARSVDHRASQELSAQHQHSDHHLRPRSPSGHRRPLLAGQPQRRRRRPPHRRSPTHRRPRNTRRRRLSRHQHDRHTPTRPHRPHHPRSTLARAPAHQGPRRTHHRPTQKLADTASMPTPRRRHRPQPPNHRRTLEPQNPQPITGQLLSLSLNVASHRVAPDYRTRLCAHLRATAVQRRWSGCPHATGCRRRIIARRWAIGR